jgi:hypothetical protein
MHSIGKRKIENDKKKMLLKEHKRKKERKGNFSTDFDLIFISAHNHKNLLQSY